MEIIHYFFNPSKRFYFVYLISAGGIALVYLWLTKRQFSKQALAQYWWNPSAKLDYAYFILGSLINLYLLVPLLLSAQTVTMWVYKQSISLWGYQRLHYIDHSTIAVLYTLCIFVGSDFSRYLLHRAMHRISWLWCFHKVHHSATSLNPVTFYRVHPVENLLFGLRYSLVIGTITGIFIYLFGATVRLWDILGANIFIFSFNVLGGNLRHSHITIHYPRFIERFFMSPYQHQLHHSIYYTRCNYGGYLSIWDTLFGTLKLSKDTLPEQGKQIGLGEKNNAAYRSLGALIFKPFFDIYLRLKGQK